MLFWWCSEITFVFPVVIVTYDWELLAHVLFFDILYVIWIYPPHSVTSVTVTTRTLTIFSSGLNFAMAKIETVDLHCIAQFLRFCSLVSSFILWYVHVCWHAAMQRACCTKREGGKCDCYWLGGLTKYIIFWCLAITFDFHIGKNGWITILVEGRIVSSFSGPWTSKYFWDQIPSQFRWF